MAHGKVAIFNPVAWDPAPGPRRAAGYGWHEAPRGSLGHWVEIEGKSIKNYQAVVPTTWNAGPRDAQGQRGAYEASLLSTPVADPDRPLEDPAHHSFLRSLHRLRGARDRRQGREVYTPSREGRGGYLGGPVQLITRPTSTPKARRRIESTHMSDARHPMLPESATVAVYVWQYPAAAVPLGPGHLDWRSLLHRLLHPQSVHRGPGATSVPDGLVPLRPRSLRDALHRAVPAAPVSVLRRQPLGATGGSTCRCEAEQFKEMLEVMKFYAFIRPTPISKIGHNAMAAFSYIGLYALVLVEIVTGLVMFNWLRHSPILGPLVGWIPRLVSFPNLRLIHFFLMFVFIAFGIFHVHLCHADLARGEARTDGQHFHRLQGHSGRRAGRRRAACGGRAILVGRTPGPRGSPWTRSSIAAPVPRRSTWASTADQGVRPTG